MSAFFNQRLRVWFLRPSLGQWGGVLDYAQQPWVKRQPGVLLAALFLTVLLSWMGLPVWFIP